MLYNYAPSPRMVDQTPWAQAYSQMNAKDQFWFDMPENRDAAYEAWLRSMMPSLSNSQEKTLRSAYSSIMNNFLAQRINQDSGLNAANSWIRYLKDFDVNRELARLAPSARYEDPGRYMGRARWVAF